VPPTSGDTWACEARAAWGDDRIIIGASNQLHWRAWMNAQPRAYVTRVLDQMPTFVTSCFVQVMQPRMGHRSRISVRLLTSSQTTLEMISV